MECPNRNSFCYLCVMFLPIKKRRIITDSVRRYLKTHFQFVWEDKVYAPQYVCVTCQTNLSSGAKGYLKYLKPAKWLEPEWEHDAEQCYFCVNLPLTIGITWANRSGIKYVYEFMVPPVIRPDEDRPKSTSPTTR